MRQVLQPVSRPRWWVLALPACLALAACDDAAEPGEPYRIVQGGQPERGRLLMSRYQCGSCHTIPGAVSHSVAVGPPLDGFGRRSYIAGRIPNGPRNLQLWLQDPPALVPPTTMPKLGVTPEDARDLAAYLLSLT